MPDAPPRYAVLLADDDSLRPMDVARALAAARKVPFLDVAPAMRRAWGIVAEGDPKDAAEAAAAALNAAGLKAMAVPASLLEDLPRPRAVNALAFEEGGCSHSNRQGETGRFAWERLTLLSAADIVEVISEGGPAPAGPDPGKQFIKKTFSMMTGIPTSIGMNAPAPEARKRVTEESFLVELHLRGPAERLRIDAAKFDFSCLGARKGMGLAGNLKILLETIRAAAPKAALGRGARAVVEGRPLSSAGYERAADLERESRWRLTLAALKPAA